MSIAKGQTLKAKPNSESNHQGDEEDGMSLAKGKPTKSESEAEEDGMSIVSQTNNKKPSKKSPSTYSSSEEEEEEVDSDENGENSDEEEDDGMSSKSKLPEEKDLTEAFSHLIDFDFPKMMPKNLVTPLSEISMTDAQRAELDGTQLALEKNVKRLFYAGEEINTIKEALIQVVSEDNQLKDLRDPKSREKKLKAIKKLMKDAKPHILKFYPRLLELIQALLAYHVQEYDKSSVDENSVIYIMFGVWRKVLSHLTSIQHVITFGAKKGYFDLASYPHAIDAVTNKIEKSKMTLLKLIAKQTDQIQGIQKLLNDKEKSLNAVKEKHKGLLELKLSHGTVLNNLKRQLDAISDARQIALKNIGIWEEEHPEEMEQEKQKMKQEEEDRAAQLVSTRQKFRARPT